MRKLLAAAVSFAMCVPILPAAEFRTTAELVPQSLVSEESTVDISYAAVVRAESTSASKTTSTTKKTSTTSKKKTTTTTTTTKKSATTTTTTTTKKTTTTANKTTVTTAVSTEAPLMLGDIDNDKMITGSDATWILREYTLISGETDGELTETQRKACDVDGDERITGSDATLTLSYYIYEGSGGVLEFEDFIKYGPIDIQTTTTTSPITQLTTTTTTTTALDTETTTQKTTTSTETTITEPLTTQSTSTTTTAPYTETTTGKTSTDTETGTTTTAPPYIDPDTVQEIKLSHYNTTLYVGDGDMPLVTMYPETAPDKSEKWWSSDTSIATVNHEGWIIGIAPGECTVTVQSVDNPDVTAEIQVTVIDNKVTEIAVDRDEITIAVNKGDMPLVTMYPETAPDKSEIWWSSDTSIATVNYEGWIVGIKPGECIVTVQSAANPDVKAEIKVTVTDEGLVKKITLNKYEIELIVSEGDMPLVTMLPADAEDKSEIWWSSDASVATVNCEGWIVGTGAGECTVTVCSAANPEIIAEIKVIVKED